MQDIDKNMKVRIADIRKSKNMTQIELAEKADTTHWTISNIETGRYMPSTRLLERIAKALDVPFKDLFL